MSCVVGNNNTAMTTRDSFIFSQRDLIPSSFYAFEDMKWKNELTDFEIGSKNKSFKVHRLVLAAAIPYFRENSELHLDGVDPGALESLINFAYSGKIETSSENIQPLIIAAKFFDLGKVYEACCKFLEERIHANNVWEIRTFAESQDCSELVDIADQYIKQNFESFVESDSFKDLNFSHLREIISADDLRVTTEEKVFEAVMRWVKFSPVKRRDHLPVLLSAIRMSELTSAYLSERVSCEDLVKSCNSCRGLIEEAKFANSALERVSGNCSFTTRQRNSDVTKCQQDHCLYAVCDSESGISVKCLNMVTHKWIDMSFCEVKHLQCVAAVDKRIYIFLEDTIRFFDVENLTWRLLDTSHETLLMSGAACHKKNIYFFGGPQKFSNIIRCFSPGKDAWLKEDIMANFLECPAAASLGNFIYVTGGCLHGVIHRTVGRYDPETKKWKKVAPMLARRNSHGCTSFNGKIYVCGGCNETEYLSTMEVYDPKTNHWKFISSMKAPRTHFTIVPYDGKIYALGGLTEGYTAAVEMEVYSPDSDKWECGVSLSDVSKSEIFLVKAGVPVSTTVYKKESSSFQAEKWKFMPSCNYCLKTGHPPEYCWYKNKICFACGQSGHFAVDCTLYDRDEKCSKCGKYGFCVHNPISSKRTDIKCCFLCGEKGHLARDCASSKSNKRLTDAPENHGHF